MNGIKLDALKLNISEIVNIPPKINIRGIIGPNKVRINAILLKTGYIN